MRVLFVMPYAPSRIRVRPFGFIRHLARQHDVNVLALESRALNTGALTDLGELRREGIPVTVIQEPRYRPYLRTLESALVPRRDPLPLQVAYTASPALRAAVATELRARSYDVLHIEHVRGLGALPTVPDMPAVWDAVDCVSLLFTEGARYAQQHGRISAVRVAGPLEARRLAAFERRRIARFRQVLVTSERDRRALLELAGVSRRSGEVDGASTLPDITVLPHGIEVGCFNPGEQGEQGEAQRRPDTLIFSGKMDYHANVAGALMLAQEIMPLVWRERPETRLIIAGNKPPRAVRHLARDQRISVTGYVRDLNALVATATIAISPLPYAVGIQNKILEAMARGTPVVASAIAAQGLQAMPGRDLLMAETPDDLAAAVLRLLNDTNLRSQVGSSGQSYVAEYHNWDRIIKRLTAVYERARAQEGASALAGAPADMANGHATRTVRVYGAGWKSRRERTPAAALAANPDHVSGEEATS